MPNSSLITSHLEYCKSPLLGHCLQKNIYLVPAKVPDIWLGLRTQQWTQWIWSPSCMDYNSWRRQALYKSSYKLTYDYNLLKIQCSIIKSAMTRDFWFIWGSGQAFLRSWQYSWDLNGVRISSEQREEYSGQKAQQRTVKTGSANFFFNG